MSKCAFRVLFEMHLVVTQKAIPLTIHEHAFDSYVVDTTLQIFIGRFDTCFKFCFAYWARTFFKPKFELRSCWFCNLTVHRDNRGRTYNRSRTPDVDPYKPCRICRT